MPQRKMLDIVSSKVPLKRSERLLKRATLNLKMSPNEASRKSGKMPLRKASQQHSHSKTKVNLASQKTLQSSSKAVVRRQSVICMICKKSFTSKKKLKDHNTRHHFLRHCPNCPKTFKRSRKFMLHLQSHIRCHPYECNICLGNFNEIEDLLKHKRTDHKNPGRYPCETCSEVFPHRFALNRHRSAHNGPPYICDDCGLVFSNLADLTLHVKNQVYRCLFCLNEVIVFPTIIDLVSHMESVHEDESNIPGPFERCVSTGAVNLNDEDGVSDSMEESPSDYDESDLVVDNNYQRDAVEPVYNLKRKDKFICFICFDLYPTCELLKSHMKGHRWYPCDSCPKFFPDAVTLAEHKCDFVVVPSPRCEVCSAETKCESCRTICVGRDDISGEDTNETGRAYLDRDKFDLLWNFVERIKLQKGPLDHETFLQISYYYKCFQQVLESPLTRSLFRAHIPDIMALYLELKGLGESQLNQQVP